MGTIDQFRENFGEGQRVSLFTVTGNFPSGVVSGAGGGNLTELMVKSAQFPASTIGIIEVPYKGRKIKMPGDRVFAEWTATVLVDKDHTLHEAFVGWMDQINSHTDVESSGIASGLKADWVVSALAPDGGINQEITLVQCWPSEVGTVDYAWETTDTLAEFTVTFQFDYWESNATS